MQCCGEPFAAGDKIEWTVVPADQEWLTSVLGDALASTVTDAEEHHASDDMTLTRLRGAVVEVKAAYCQYEASPGQRTMLPVAGSGTTAKRVSVDGWEPADAGMTFVGYVVDVAD